jgi:hypothetical protein
MSDWDRDFNAASAALERAFRTADGLADLIDDVLPKLEKAKKALRKIADFSEADPVKYIQGVDAIALDTLAELEGEL